MKTLTSLAVGCALTWVSSGWAAPPAVPLPPPVFSFDLASPSVQSSLVGAADLLVLSGGSPSVEIQGWRLGLPDPQDDLDGLSTSHVEIGPNDFFAPLFSVTRQSAGLAPPEAILVTFGRPFNMKDQATRGHAAGDEFMSLALFTRGGSLERAPLSNNTQVRNNYDEGGTDFGAVPHVDSYGNPVPDPARYVQDNVDAASVFPHDGTGWHIHDVYFSASGGSPSLSTLPGSWSPSGAHVFFNPDPRNLAPTQLYASHEQLGLQQLDDIDALLVFDTNADGVFNGTDRLVFSLKYNSPSLYTIPGTAADLFVVTPTQPPALFAPAAAYGLGHPQDDIDALDLVLCVQADACALDYAIQALKGDLNCDGHVDFGDINPFVLALSNPSQYQAQFPGCFIQNGDINMDGSTGFGDINPFVALLSGRGGPGRAADAAGAR